MQPDPSSGLWLIVLFLLVGLKWLIGRTGLFRGFAEGFWAAFFSRLLVGPRSPASTNPLGCLVMVALLLLLLMLLGVIGSIRAQ